MFHIIDFDICIGILFLARSVLTVNHSQNYLFYSCAKEEAGQDHVYIIKIVHSNGGITIPYKPQNTRNKVFPSRRRCHDVRSLDLVGRVK